MAVLDGLTVRIVDAHARFGHFKIIVGADHNQVTDGAAVARKVYFVYRGCVEACPEPVEGKSATVSEKSGLPRALAASS